MHTNICPCSLDLHKHLLALSNYLCCLCESNDEYPRRESPLPLIGTGWRGSMGDNGRNPEVDELKVGKIRLSTTQHL